MAEGRGRGRGRRKKAAILADAVTPPDQNGLDTLVTSVRKRQVKVEQVDVGADVRADLSPLKRSSTATLGLGTTSRVIAVRPPLFGLQHLEIVRASRRLFGREATAKWEVRPRGDLGNQNAFYLGQIVMCENWLLFALSS